VRAPRRREPRRMPAIRLRHVAGLLAGASLVVAGCGGDDAEKSAQTKVCNARADISKSVDSLKAMTPATVTGDAVRGDLQTIKDSLKQIRGAQADLSGDRRKQLKQANEKFAAEIRSVGATVLRSTSAEEGRAQVKSAVQELGGVYRTTLATVDCS
jgi:hypothetical protein